MRRKRIYKGEEKHSHQQPIRGMSFCLEVSLQPGLRPSAVYLAMAMAATVVKEVAMASMASPKLPSSSHAVCLRGSQTKTCLWRSFQSGPHPNPCCSSSPMLSSVVLTGSHPKLCVLGVLHRESQLDLCLPRVFHDGTNRSRQKSSLGNELSPKSCVLGRSGALSRFSCRASSSSSSSSQVTQRELPEKLQEIVRVFQGVTEPRAKCEQLLHYASKLKPLAEEQKQPENKVEGCVSKVYIVCEFNEEDGRVYFEAESDVMLTKGLAGLLVEGLSGVTVEEVLNLTPDFVHMLGLKQSLTPSRSNGFLNMLKLIQKKTLQVYLNSKPMVASNATVPIASIDIQDCCSDHASSKKHLI